MEMYLVVETVKAEPQVRDGREGYLILHKDGYDDWCPKETFEKMAFKLDEGDTLTQRDIERFMDWGKAKDSVLDERCSLVEMVLPNGYMMTESSACVNKSRFSHDMGVEICFGHLYDRLWKLMGFVLAWGKNGLTQKKV